MKINFSGNVGDAISIQGKEQRLRAIDITPDYLAHLKPFSQDIEGIKVVLDCSNSSSGPFARKLFGELSRLSEAAVCCIVPGISQEEVDFLSKGKSNGGKHGR